MFPAHHHYVPVLKWKRAEQTALSTLNPQIKAGLTPLIEIIIIPVDLDTGSPNKTLEQHVDPAVQKLVTAWGTTDTFFLDPEAVAGEVSATGIDGATYVFSEAQILGLQFVPVTGIYRTPTDVAAAMGHAQRGLCIRLAPEDLANANVSQDIASFLTAHRLAMHDVDIIVDLEAVVGQSVFVVVGAITHALRTLPNIASWRTFTVVASAFPENMGVLQTLTSQLIERVEWKAWMSLYSQRAQLPRLPTFGDYAIQHPTGSEGFDPRYMQMSASIRYTLRDEWLLIKGRSTKVQKSSLQYPALARHLIAQQGFFGQAHCRGCTEAFACANNTPGLGSPEVWRRIGTSHHLTVAATQLGATAYP